MVDDTIAAKSKSADDYVGQPKDICIINAQVCASTTALCPA